jgi:hypothetical protein
MTISTRTARSIRAGISAARLPWPLRWLWFAGTSDSVAIRAYDATREHIEQQASR